MKRVIAIVAIVVALVAGVAIGYGVRSALVSVGHEGHENGTEARVQWWTCSMHPQVHEPEPGKCPYCGMDLVPVKEEAGADTDPRQLVMSKAAKVLAEIETAPVVRKSAVKTVRMVGKIEYDETLLSYIAAWVPGRIDRIYVDYTGITVRKGDHMVQLYSPELVSTQEELLQAIDRERKLEESGSADARRMARSVRVATEERLRLWGVSAGQIEEIKKTGSTVDHLTIFAPVGGVVIKKHVSEGAYVKTGSRLYTIADLSKVWIFLDAYESDIAWVRYGQEVEIEAEAYKGETFKGRIAFIEPFLNEKTHTVRLRVNVPNLEGSLKPGMFVHATVRAGVAASGRVVDPAMAGKWICPMHPEVTSEEADTCRICEMDLVTTESLGYISADEADAETPLVIPVTAPLITGKRAVVYVEVPGADRPTYEFREVVLGAHADEYYIVRSGLKEGEKVVVYGNFKIDSQMQILGRPSMMSPGVGDDDGAPGAPGDGSSEGEGTGGAVQAPADFRKGLSSLLSTYIEAQAALASDDDEKAKAALKHVSHALEAVDMKLLDVEAHTRWMRLSKSIRSSASEAVDSAGIVDTRRAFALLSDAVMETLTAFGHAGPGHFYELFCPMAFDGKGASWVQRTEETANPYLGAEMLECGTVKREF